MTLNVFLYYFALTLFGMILLFVAFSTKKKLERNKEYISGEKPKEKDNTETQQGKNKQQLELELLLINNNTLLKILGIFDKNLKLKLLLTFFLFGVYYLFNLQDDLITLVLAGAGIFVFVILIPGMTTSSVLKRKVKKIMADLPGFVDLVAVCVQTGISIDAALKRVASDFEVLNPDLTYVMLRIIRKSEITGLSAALQDLAISLPTKEIRMFCTVLQQSLNFGSSIYSHLTQLSADIREMQLLEIEEKLGTLAAKMSIPLIVFIMFPIVILILAPGAMRVFPNVF
ncbi:type II secretion system F family protein [Lonepinella koalarum]|uniref:type II secretion system F family protein n=1 Tax=Lonepinella koalarum TaxID=53417 RepID=UPI0011E4339B|nr:type II secretion system F family protein [Lonepinella koalarum]TYG35104.1 type II secretion system F family protein [Lonepinella koalarum]